MIDLIIHIVLIPFMVGLILLQKWVEQREREKQKELERLPFKYIKFWWEK